MTAASELIKRYNATTKIISTKDIALRIDPQVQIARDANTKTTFYTFSDGSVAHTRGRGRHSKITVGANPCLAPTA